MRKYIKWILLIILIISLIVTTIMFVNFSKGRTNSDKSKISQIFDKEWVRTGLSIYKNGELSSQNLNLSDSRYIVFNEEFVSYCNYLNNECSNYYYEYNEEDDMIFIDSEDYLIEKGTYKITFYENTFDLSLIYDEGYVTFHFDTPKG